MFNWEAYLPHTPFEVFTLAVYLLCPLCATVIFTAILINFLEAKYSGQVSREKRSFVATGSMIGFFLGVYLLIHYRVGVLHFETPAKAALMALGAIILILGTVTNVLGRLRLGRNWANQATLYSDQTLVSNGIYGVVRHPLYASLIWIFYAAGLIYQNYAVILANTLIFLPAMYYRAHLEEILLEQRFPEYARYRRRVGTFFPKLLGGDKHESL